MGFLKHQRRMTSSGQNGKNISPTYIDVPEIAGLSHETPSKKLPEMRPFFGRV